MKTRQHETLAGILCAAAMIAHQVGGKSVRDALFLSSFAVTDLPKMIMVSAILSILFVLASSRIMRRHGPARVVPIAFVISAAFNLIEWAVYLESPGIAAVLLYLHIGSFSAVLISGFWSMINEHYDPYTAKKRIVRIAAGGTMGGLLGGLLAARLPLHFAVATMLPILAVVHLLAAWFARALRPLPSAAMERENDLQRQRDAEEGGAHGLRKGWRDSGLRTLGEVPYLRNLALLILLATVGATLIDYVFKSRAVDHFGGSDAQLMRFFAFFYTILSLITFFVQTSVGRYVLERLGLARAAASVPLAITLGGVGLLVGPGLPAAAIARGSENILRGSIFRAGYELFFTPIPAHQKRATKSIIDVGFDRLGDLLGGGIISLVLLGGTHLIHPWLMVVAVIVGVAGLLVARRLHFGYIGALEKSLMAQGVQLNLEEIGDSTTRTTVMRTIAALKLSSGTMQSLADRAKAEAETADGGRAKAASAADPDATRDARRHPGTTVMKSVIEPGVLAPGTGGGGGAVPAQASSGSEPEPRPSPADPYMQRIADLRSGDAARVRRVLADRQALTPDLAQHLIPLLAWDDVCVDTIQALQGIVDKTIGQLLDPMLDPDEEFAIRRRIPRVLCVSESQRAVDGLFRGLGDRRFEVRYQCGRALRIIRSRTPAVRIDRKLAMAAVRREAAVSQRVWQSQRLLDRVESTDALPFTDEVLRDRTNRSLEHVFTILSLVLPAEPLRVAYRGLLTDDRVLRGTALEYLESVLPADVRERLWPQIEGDTREPVTTRSNDQVLADLLQSHQSIEMNLAALRKRHSSQSGPTAE